MATATVPETTLAETLVVEHPESETAASEHDLSGVADPEARARAMANHPSALASAVTRFADEAGSVIAEYGLLIVLAATVAMLAIKWATGGAVFDLFGAIMTKVRAVAGL